MLLRKLTIFALLFSLFSFVFANESKNIKIGILTFRSKPQTVLEWSPTMALLGKQIQGYQFEVVALSYPELERAVQNKEVDFIVTNPGHYVFLESKYGVTRIATIVKMDKNEAVATLGSVIFTKNSNNNINSLKDLKNKKIAIVDYDSLGGYMAGMAEIQNAGIYPKDFSKTIETGMPHDKVVSLVQNGEVDVGVVRTGLLELMNAEGLIKLDDFKILAPKTIGNFPFLCSTKLYPEWPFAKLNHASNELASKILMVLLDINHDSEAATKGGYFGWTIPLDYESVHQLMRELHIKPYNQSTQINFIDVISAYKYYLILASIFLALLIISQLKIISANKKLTIANKAQIEIQTQIFEITNTLGEGMYVIDRLGIITFINPKACELLGYGQDELLGKNAHKLIHYKKQNGEEYLESDCKIANLINHKMGYESDDETFWQKNTKPLYVSVVSAPMIRNKEVVGSVVSFRDIGRQKEMESMLLASNQTLFKVLNNIDISVMVVDIQTHDVIFLNDFAKKTFGSIIARKCYEGVDELEKVCEFCKFFNTEDIKLGKTVEWEYKNIRSGRWYLYREHIAEWIDGRLVGLQVSIDITDKKELELNLEYAVNEEIKKRQSQEEIIFRQSKMAMMGEMIGAIAHQWKQPLSALALLVQDVQFAFENDEINDAYIKKLEANGMLTITHMSQTIDDFRDFFKPDKEKVNFETVNIIQDVLSLLSSKFRELQIETAIKDDGESHMVYGYKNELKQALINILNNAKDALEENGVKNPKIVISVKKSLDGKIGISIQDNAGGIPNDIIDKVFNPYFTTKGDDKGTGIGLSMTKSIIEDSMNGKLSVQNENDGVKFYIEIPNSTTI